MTEHSQLDTHHDADLEPELERLSVAERPDGPGAAAILAAGFGMFVLGLLTVLNEASESMHGFLEDFQGGVGVGPLAGKTTLGSIGFLVSWGLLSALWWRRDVNLKVAAWIALALGVLGLVGTFPTFFEIFAD